MGRQGKNNKAANRTGGVILNIGSIHGLVSMPMMPFYSATKAGINALTRIAGGKEQFGEHGVRIICLCPCGVNTQNCDSVLPCTYSLITLITSFRSLLFINRTF